MRVVTGSAVVAFTGLALYAAGCAAGVETNSGGTSSATSAGQGGGTTGAGGQGGEACVPTDEVCGNGLDDDCNGEVDETCDCADGETQSCYSGPAGTESVGACKAGTQACDPATHTFGPCTGEVLPASGEDCNGVDDDCDGEIDQGVAPVTCGIGACAVTVPGCGDGAAPPCSPGAPSVEVCDGVDNDCDQLTDESFPNQGSACSSGIPGACSAGTQQCLAGVQTCVQNLMASNEICDGVDNDCDGTTDNDIPGTGGACSTGFPGVCSPGTISCQGGAIDCFPLVPASNEVCDGLDNDCDGQTDESNPGGGGACVTGQPGLCSPGTVICTNGALVCTPNVASAPETCDGLDNNCDGQTDEGDPGGNVACSTGLAGACAAGTKHCQSGALACTQNVASSPEVCDGVDNDCNGQVDNGNPGGGAACVTGLQGACSPGTITCQGGQLSCLQNVQPVPEICGNGIDDDCNGVGDPNVVTYFSETFANNAAGWTLGTSWAIGSAAAGCSDPAADHTPTADNGVAGVVLGGCAPTPIHPYYYLTSPVINTAAAPAVFLEFYRWLNTDYTPYMNSVIEVFNGSSWTVVWQNGASGLYESTWTKQSINISAYKSATMQVRFGFNINSGGVFSVGQWNIDDLTITSAQCN